jgi:hypothetical protein
MLVTPRCPKCNSSGLPFDSNNPVNHFCPNPKCGEMINALDCLQRIKDRIQKSMR